MGRAVTIAQFEMWSLYICVGGLILYMFFIMYKLAKDSNAGKFGTLIIFIGLGLGVMAFVIKEVVLFFIEI